MVLAGRTGTRPANTASTTARTGGTVAARAARSSPLLRPPAMSTTDENPATAARTEAGVVALESSYQPTPPSSPTKVTRWGSGGVLTRAARHPAGVAPAERATAVAA